MDLQQLCRSIRSHVREWTLNGRKVDMLQATTDVNLSSRVPPLAHLLSGLRQISQVFLIYSFLLFIMHVYLSNHVVYHAATNMVERTQIPKVEMGWLEPGKILTHSYYV